MAEALGAGGKAVWMMAGAARCELVALQCIRGLTLAAGLSLVLLLLLDYFRN